MSEGLALQVGLQFVTVECCSCHMVYAVDQRTRERWLASGESFYCPAGHRQHYATSTVQKLERQLEQQRHEIERQERRARRAEAEAKIAGYRERAQKAAKTRLKNRLAAGVCPCCTRTFQNLAAHMKTQHPDFAGAEGRP